MVIETIAKNLNGANAFEGQGTPQYQLAEFWDVPPAERTDILLNAIATTHAKHFALNSAYRRTVSARGIQEDITREDLPRLLRPTAQTFKSYIELLGTPFPDKKPQAFVQWLDDQISIGLPQERFEQFREQYPSLEALLQDFERIFSDFGFEILTSSGTSGRSTIMVRDQDGMDKTVESFYLAFQRYLGMKADHRAIFIMPQQTRIAMARMAGFSIARVGLTEDRVHFTIPFSAEPDQVRIRAGRTYRPDFRGLLERKIYNPFMNWANESVVMPRAIRLTVDLLKQAQESGEKVLVFGGWIQLHAVAQEISARGTALRLAPGSLLGTGGGFKELYPFNQDQIRNDLEQVIQSVDGSPLPLRDVYGMAEGNWAAMQCSHGNYHIPPWVYAVTVDDDGEFQEQADAIGLLAFFDPFGSGNLFPAFFKTQDRMRLINGAGTYDPTLACACGDEGAYITKGSIQRVDLLDEAGCAAQI